jgi:hypothetical protein
MADYIFGKGEKQVASNIACIETEEFSSSKKRVRTGKNQFYLPHHSSQILSEELKIILLLSSSSNLW